MTFRKIIVSLTLLCLAGCIRPHYTPPYLDLPNDWRLPSDDGTTQGSTLCNMRWWEQFGDPVLNDLILTALENNQDLQVAICRVCEFYDQFRVISADLYPAINGNFSYTRTEVSAALPGGPPPPTVGRINNDFKGFFNLSWELDFWGRIYSASEAAYADFLSQVEARRAVVVTIVASVANGYIKLRELDLDLAISEKTLESRIEALHIAKSRYELGETSEMEVKQAQSEVNDAAIRMIAFERDIPKQENLLSILLGENPRAIMRGRPLNTFLYPIAIPTGLPSDLLMQRPDIMQAEDRLIAANARITQARALFFPQITLTGMYGSESSELKNFLTGPAEMWQYGVNAVQAIFDAGKIYYLFKEAESIRCEALYTYKQAILNAFAEVNDALIDYQKNRELVEQYQDQVKVLTDYLRLAKLNYNEGEADYLTVLDAERTLFDAQLQLALARSNSFSAVVQLYSALGGGWVIDADTIALNGRTYSPCITPTFPYIKEIQYLPGIINSLPGIVVSN